MEAPPVKWKESRISQGEKLGCNSDSKEVSNISMRKTETRKILQGCPKNWQEVTSFFMAMLSSHGLD